MRTRPVSAFALPLLFAVAGCSSNPVSSYLASSETTGSIEGPTRPVRGTDLATALASMPEPGGTPLTMREKFYSNGVRQEIVLAGDKAGFGENVLSIAVQSAAPAAGARDKAPVYRPSESGIKSEIVSRYPQIDMQILTQPRRNALGPIGLAIGRHASGARCVFAWQWIDDIRNPGASSSTLGKLGSLGSSDQPALIRVHMCRKDATVDDLAAAVEGLTLAPQPVIDRVLDGSRASATVSTRPAGGGLGGTVVASEGSLESALTTAVRSKVQVASSGAPRQRIARRARKKAEPVAEETVAQQQSPVAPVYASGPRYLAPIAGGAPGGLPVASAYAVPAYTASAGYGGGTATKTLDPSLPAAAYRGPGGSGR